MAMDNAADALQQLSEQVDLAMSQHSCRMVSAAILCGYICAGEQPCSPQVSTAVELLADPPQVLTGQFEEIIKNNHWLWSAEAEVRQQLFKEGMTAGQLDLEDLIAVIFSGASSWHVLMTEKKVSAAELMVFFSYVKRLFTQCAGEKGRFHPDYSKVTGVLNIAINLVS